MKTSFFAYSVILLISVQSSCKKNAADLCGNVHIETVEKFKVFKTATGAFTYRAKFAIDADGSPHAYGPNDIGLDFNSNAITDGKWVGVVLGTDSKPIIQKMGDPYPGYYVSQTALYDEQFNNTDPRSYVDAEKIPYIVLPESLKIKMGAEMGDMAYVFNPATQKGTYAILADEGPEGLLGEGSIYLAKVLGIANISPRDGGLTGEAIQYIIFPKSGIGNGKHRTIAQIEQVGKAQLDKMGGAEAVLKCF
jgi:Fungal chitosanase of glycosyl hydrolase group 75